jgi:hypothetical protein
MLVWTEALSAAKPGAEIDFSHVDNFPGKTLGLFLREKSGVMACTMG